MRYVGTLIRLLGEQTENIREQVTDTSGIPDSLFLEYLNDAQTRLQSIAIRNIPHLTLFDKQETISIVGGTGRYDIPERAIYGQMVRMVEYRDYAQEDRYYELSYESSLRLMAVHTSDRPSSYCVLDRKIALSPIPAATIGNLRVTYPQAVRTLDLRRGKVESIVDDGTSYTSIVVADDDELSPVELSEADYICVVNRYGASLYPNLLVSSYDSSNRQIHIESASMADGTIPVGSYVVCGKNSTTHSDLIREAEKYLMAYAAWKLFKKDSSTDAVEQNEELVAIEEECLATLSNLSLGTLAPPILDREWFN